MPNDKGQNYSEAVARIKAEMAEKNNPYTRAVGNMLMKQLDTNPQGASKILAKDKTIAKSLDEMRKEAEKHRSGSCAVLTDEEGFAVVLKYYGIDGAVPAQPPASPAPQLPAAAPVRPAIDFDISLDDLL